MSESTLAKKIILALSQASRGRIKLFRNNVGVGISGKISTVAHTVDVRIKEHPGRVVLRPGDYIVRNGRRVEYGLCKGSSDYIGFMPITITPEMINKKCCIFIALEIKSGKNSATDEQNNFISVVKACGGVAEVVYSEKQALEVMNGYEKMDALRSP